VVVDCANKIWIEQTKWNLEVSIKQGNDIGSNCVKSSNLFGVSNRSHMMTY
jgi:hypothetical protein